VETNRPQPSTVPLPSIARSPERPPLTRVQVKPIAKAIPTPRETRNTSSNNADNFQKTEVNHISPWGKTEPEGEDFLPIPIDRPTGLAIDDFLPVIKIQ